MWAAMDDQKIQQFTSITGAPVEEAKSLLEACNGDVNMAVSMHLDSKGPSSSTATSMDSSTLTRHNDAQTYEER